MLCVGPQQRLNESKYMTNSDPMLLCQSVFHSQLLSLTKELDQSHPFAHYLPNEAMNSTLKAALLCMVRIKSS
eukprot:scaffold7732_cov36-Attheya_sp.AAC.1